MMEVNILSFCYFTQLTTNIYTQVMGREGVGDGVKEPHLIQNSEKNLIHQKSYSITHFVCT